MQWPTTILKNNIVKLIQWESANPNIPEVVKAAIHNYRAEMKKAIEESQKHPFEDGEKVELYSSSFEDSGLFSGDIGWVRDIQSTSDSIGQKEWDVLVEWEHGEESCWIGADNLTSY